MNVKLSNNQIKRPDWLKVKAFTGANFQRVSDLMRLHQLRTVCEEAACPNIFECYQTGRATFLILGDVCSRNCGFCQVKSGQTRPLDPSEPARIAKAVQALGLRYVVITSVTRDDLPYGGADIFVSTIREIRKINTGCMVEVLIPDFGGNSEALKMVVDAGPDVLAHNLETVARLYPTVRPRAGYDQSLELLACASDMGAKTKSGIMVGLGESHEEVYKLMNDVVSTGTGIFTIGHYLQPSAKHLPIIRFYSPEEFEVLEKAAYLIGFDKIKSGPLVRSSYLADF